MIFFSPYAENGYKALRKLTWSDDKGVQSSDRTKSAKRERPLLLNWQAALVRMLL